MESKNQNNQNNDPSWVGPFGWVAGCLGLLYFVFDIKSGGSLFAVLYWVAFGFISWMLVKNGLKLAVVMFDKLYESESSSSLKDKIGQLIVEAAQKKTGEANGENPDPKQMDMDQMKAELQRLYELEKQQQAQQQAS